MKAPVVTLAAEAARALFDHISTELAAPEHGRCDHTLRHSREWCEANGVPWEETRAWLKATGGYCDCEVLMNSAAQFEGQAA